MGEARFSHRDRRVVVTGGGGGIGRAMTAAFAEEGARLVICGRTESSLRQTAEQNPDRISYLTADVSKLPEVERFADHAAGLLGGIDVWINNAGTLLRGVLPEADAEHFRRQWEINVTGVWNGCRSAVAHMQDAGGVILNISSYLSQHAGASASIPAYTAGKGAVSALTRSLAVRHGPQGIRVNAICPAFIPTGLNAEAWEGAEDRDTKLAEIGRRYPLRRVGTPAEVANAALYLASNEASWITGIELVVDGGISAV